jgi:hypothetical protein
LERILLEWIQPRSALQSVGLSTLKEICRTADAPSSGNKDELIERIISHFAQGRDCQEEEPVEVRQPEPRRLSQSQFETMFSALTHQELTEILRRQPELRQTGTKELRIRTLWDAQLSETTLLSELMNRQLEDILHRLGLKLSGSKSIRVERIIEHFASTTFDRAMDPQMPGASTQEVESASLPAEVAANQLEFRQRASNPQVSLQPWLDSLLGAGGMVRCYATEDANPTKQLKNKLAQAAAARDGLLVLLLADESAYMKAREALIERWLTNDEWSKSVACVALAYPLGDPNIYLIVERGPNPWSRSLQRELSPQMEIVRVLSQSIAASCSICGAEPPLGARFCPQCGKQLNDDRQTS